MGGDQPGLTPQQARAQLAASQRQLTASRRDRTVHATGTAVVGLDCGLLAATQNMAHGATKVVLSFVFFAAWLGAAAWSGRISRTVPRNARRWALCGIGASFALALFAVLPWLNLQAQDSPNTWPMALVAAVVVAVPCLVAAAVIAVGRR